MPPLDFLVLKEVNRGLANFIKINQHFKPYILSQALKWRFSPADFWDFRR